MKSLLLLLFAVAFCAAAHATVSSTFTQTYPLTANGQIRVENINGTVEITAWDKNEVSLVAEKSAPNEEELAKLEVKIDAKSDRLAVKTERKKTGMFDNNWRGEVKYRLQVPARCIIEKVGVVNANVSIRDVKGSLNVESVNGEIKVQGVAANGRFKTVNGSLTIGYADFSNVEDIRLETVNGSCRLTIPPAVNLRIEGHTVNGSVHCEFPVTIDSSGRGKFLAHVGDGGPNVDFHAVNGGLKVASK